MLDILYNIGLVIAIILIFNFVIFIHELGHFLAAKWRGVVADRFQIWFGKPIWKKTIGGVQYGIGWIPAGGFVSLPQLASMEGIEGSVGDDVKEKLPPVKPIDKIIVAFAGPLFSFLLAIVAAFIVWGTGRPDNKIATTTVGYIQPGSPADGVFQLGDKILSVEGNPVAHWQGDAKASVVAQVILSEGDTVEYEIERDGKKMQVSTGFTVPETHFLKRGGKRRVGISYIDDLHILQVLPNGPAHKAGIQAGDEIVGINGGKAYSPTYLSSFIKKGEAVDLKIKRGSEVFETKLQPEKPKQWDTFAAGVVWDSQKSQYMVFKDNLVYQDPWTQIKGHVDMMVMTIQKIASPDNNINLGDLSSPYGIVKQYYLLLTSEKGWTLVLWFTVLLNVNLGILNLMPFPVLDGGHIVTSFYEMIVRRPIPTKVMLVLQNSFVLILMGFMLFLLSKDFFDDVIGDGKEKEYPPMQFEAPAKNE